MKDTVTWLPSWPPTAQATDINPFASTGFLSALESSGACSIDSGWEPMHLQLQRNDGRLLVPIYQKSHSWGEYVFDWAWANAYEQYGLHYYPKLVVAIPYTPSQGPRFLGAREQSDIDEAVQQLKAQTLVQQASGFHILFPASQECAWLDHCNLLRRCDVQFHWFNRDYRDFDDYLARFSSRKRKNVRKERSSIAQQGLTIKRLTGTEIDDTSWQAFYRFYHATYLKRGRQGYLNQSFFAEILHSLRQNILLVMAYQQQKAVAAALFFKDSANLYGRYWGCFEEFNNLHFEVCYYQGIEYCIEHALARFDPGTQGEHKISRGFEPTMTYSYHWLSNPQFFEAARNFCTEEQRMNQRYRLEAARSLPFKEET